MSADFERIYTQTYQQVLRYCLRRTSRDDAVDATAEVFSVAWRRREAIPPSPLPWLYGVARNVIGNQRRAARRRARLRAKASQADIASGGPELEVVRSDEHRAVVAAVERLGRRDAELIRLAAWEGLTRDQLAATLGISPNTVTQRLTRALDRLALELGTSRLPGNRFFDRRTA